jgi:hypothetical protein
LKITPAVSVSYAWATRIIDPGEMQVDAQVSAAGMINANQISRAPRRMALLIATAALAPSAAATMAN